MIGLTTSEIEYVEDRLGHDFRYGIDITKIRGELGWSPRINFKDGIRELLDENRNRR
jgi:dTDP-glucose 4,6-dehydratase